MYIAGSDQIWNPIGKTGLDPAFYLTEIPIEIPFKEILLSSLFMILLSIIVSLIPALKAGKEKPLNIFSNN